MNLPTVKLANKKGEHVIVSPERVEHWRKKGYSVVSETRGDPAPKPEAPKPEGN